MIRGLKNLTAHEDRAPNGPSASDMVAAMALNGEYRRSRPNSECLFENNLENQDEVRSSIRHIEVLKSFAGSIRLESLINLRAIVFRS